MSCASIKMDVNNNGSSMERKKREHTGRKNERERNMRRIETTREPHCTWKGETWYSIGRERGQQQQKYCRVDNKHTYKIVIFGLIQPIPVYSNQYAITNHSVNNKNATCYDDFCCCVLQHIRAVHFLLLYFLLDRNIMLYFIISIIGWLPFDDFVCYLGIDWSDRNCKSPFEYVECTLCKRQWNLCGLGNTSVLI